MRCKSYTLLAFLLVTLFALPTALLDAQGTETPAVVREAAINALNQAIPGIGRPESWRHLVPGLADNSALGCPLATGFTLSTPVTVYQIWLNYGGTEYLYHVSADGAIVVPCDNKIPGISTGGPGTVPAVSAFCAVNLSGSVLVYQSPSRTAAVLEATPTAITSLIVRGRTADSAWYLIVLEGGIQTGWIAVADTTTTDPACATLQIIQAGSIAAIGTCTLTATQANVRQSPATSAPIVQTITSGQTAFAIGRTADNSWYQIPSGWVAASVSQVSGTGCATLPVTAVAAVEFGNCPPGFSGYLQPRVQVGSRARVEDGTVPNRVRSQPQISAEVIFQLPPRTEFNIIGGPQCGNGIVWWQVTEDGQTGWTAESNVADQDYYIEPLTPLVIPSAADASGRITPQNVTRLTRINTLPVLANQQSRLAWSPGGGTLAIITVEGVKLYAYPDLQPLTVFNATLAIPTTQDQATALAFDGVGQYLVIGYFSGRIHFLDLNDGTLTTLASSHQSAISGLAFNVDNTRLITTSGYIYASFPDTFDFSVKIWDFTTFNAATGALQQLLSIASTDGTPLMGGTFAPDGTPAIITPTDVRVLSLTGVPRQTERFESTRGFDLLPANAAWFNAETRIIFASGSDVLSYDVQTGDIGRPLLQAPPGSILQIAQAPTSAPETPLLAAYVEFPDTVGNIIRIVSPATNAGIHQFTMTDVLDLAFSPDGKFLNILTATGLEFWGIGQ